LDKPGFGVDSGFGSSFNGRQLSVPGFGEFSVPVLVPNCSLGT
jgi:hypothetical protein